MYFGGSLFATVAAAVSVSRSPRIMNMMMRNSWMVTSLLFVFLLRFHSLSCCTFQYFYVNVILCIARFLFFLIGSDHGFSFSLL